MGLVGLIELEPNLEPADHPSASDREEAALWTALTKLLAGQSQAPQLPASNRLLNPLVLNAGSPQSASCMTANLHHLAEELGATTSELRASLAAALAN